MFRKIRFVCSKNGVTAGLVIESAKLDSMTMGDISKLFPLSEAPKMTTLQVSPEYVTYGEAFSYEWVYGAFASDFLAGGSS